MSKNTLLILLSYSIACQGIDILKADNPVDRLFEVELSSVKEAISSLEHKLESDLNNQDNYYWAWLLSLAHTRLFTDNLNNFLQQNQERIMQEDAKLMGNPAKIKLIEQAMNTTNFWERSFTLCPIRSRSFRYTTSDKKEKEHIMESFKWLVVAALLNYDSKDRPGEVMFTPMISVNVSAVLIFANVSMHILKKGMQEAEAWLKAHGRYNRVQKQQFATLKAKIDLPK